MLLFIYNSTHRLSSIVAALITSDCGYIHGSICQVAMQPTGDYIVSVRASPFVVRRPPTEHGL